MQKNKVTLPYVDHPAHATLVDILQWRAQHQAHQLAYTFLLDGEDEEVHLTFQDLDRQARSIAASLLQWCAPGDRVLLLFPPGLEYVAAFYGCLYAGCVAVPVYSPTSERSLPRLQAIMADAQPALILTMEHLLRKIQRWDSLLPGLAQIRCLAFDREISSTSPALHLPPITSETLAFLQYTSGSTASPKGVMISHGNLMHNSLVMHLAAENADKAPFVSWLPLFHDLGLIGNMIQTLYTGVHCILLSPVTVLQKPFRWLKAVSRYKAYASGGPNFAYELCLRRITPEQRDQLDLSHWRVAFNGAEPIHYQTLERFIDYFQPCGFRADAFLPCYGLAESTVFVTSTYEDQVPFVLPVDKEFLAQDRIVLHTVEDKEKEAQLLVGCGHTRKGQFVTIVDPVSRMRCSPDKVGEIWIAGPSVAQGYWNRAQETAGTFNAYIADDGEGPFLRSGDLGFIYNDELFITGRIKDLIIIRGRNHYPQDIELTSERSHSALRSGCGVAFSVEVDNEEQLVIVCEVQRHQQNFAEIGHAIRQAVVAEHEISVYAVVLIKPGTILKTSSGKLQRRACREAFLLESLDPLWMSIAEGDDTVQVSGGITRDMLLAATLEEREFLLQSYILATFNSALGADLLQTDVSDPLSSSGLDSLKAAEIKNRIDGDLQVNMPIVAILQGFDFDELIAEILYQLSQADTIALSPLLQEPVLLSSYPLSPNQQQLWFLYQLEPDSSFYNIPFALAIHGPMDASVLEQSLFTLVQRHEALRTTFHIEGGSPVQKIQPSSLPSLPFIDMTGLPSSEKRQEMYHQLQRETQRPFQLFTGPVIRTIVIRINPDEHILHFTIHHIISDVWSLRVIARELKMLYEMYLTGQIQPLDSPPLRFVDYILWQHGKQQEYTQQEHLTYWKNQLANLHTLEIPTDYPRPSIQTYRGDIECFELSPALSTDLKLLSYRATVTPFMLLLAAFQLLLSRLSGSSDIVVGTDIASRNHIAIRDVIGFFVNTVVMRIDVAAAQTFHELLSLIRTVCIAAYTHQDIPFSQVVEEVHPERDLSRNPLFQVLFTFQSMQLDTPEIANLTVTTLDTHSKTAKFDLSLDIVDRGDYLTGSIEYSTELFEAKTIRRIIKYFQTLLEHVVTYPDHNLLELSLLDLEERYQLVVGNNSTQADYPLHQTYIDRFAVWVGRTPDAIAVTSADLQLTYAKLDQQSTFLARQLRHQHENIGIDMPIALFTERSVNWLTALLAIFRLGASYLPIDPLSPPERLAIILSDAQPALILAEPSLLAKLPNTHIPVVLLSPELALSSDLQPFNDSMPDSLAYIIYTSGSTGRPKGAMITHCGMLNHLYAKIDTLHLDEHDCIVQTAPLSFDISLWQALSPLLCGASVHLVDDTLARDPSLLLPFLHAKSITTLELVPALLSMLLDELERQASGSATVTVPHLRWLLVTGEMFPAELALRCQRYLETTQLVNAYGPTECSDDVTHYVLPSPYTGVSVPIGTPTSNTAIYLLDDRLQLVPPGVIAEVYVSGAGVGRGYLNDPVRTASAFLPDLYSAQAGARMYRTGDIGRWTNDNQLVVVGRRDEQIKLRGYRIELGEIEAALKKHPLVQTCAVIARQQASHTQLVAYIVLVPGGEQDSASLHKQLRGYLQEKLPEYMLPAYFVPLEKLPLTVNGKLDRRALPEPDIVLAGDTEFVAPRTYIQAILAKIWRDLLALPQVSIRDNFFTLGGDSILSMQIVVRAAEAGLQVTLKQIFQYQTIEDLSAVIESAPTLQAEQQPVIGPVPLTPIQHWFFAQELEHPHHWNQAVRLEMSYPLDPALLYKALIAVVNHHDALRLHFSRHGAQWQQSQELPVETVPFTCIDLSGLSKQAQETTIQVYDTQLQASFDLAHGPLMQYAYFVCGGVQQDCLLMIIHHLLIDGVSWRILLDDVQTAYLQLRRGEPIQLPAKTTSFKQWAHRLVEYARSDILRQEFGYWLADRYREVSPLPVDLAYTATDNTEASTRTIMQSLTVQETEQLLREVPQAYHTHINTILLAALGLTITRWTGMEKVLVDVEGHGREDIFADLNVSRTVGWFTSLYPVSLEIPRGSASSEIVQAIHDQLQRLPQRGTGYGLLSYLSQHQDFLARKKDLPRAEILFNYLGQLDQIHTPAGLFHQLSLFARQLRSPQDQRSYLIDINCLVNNGQFHITWTYSTCVHHAATIEQVSSMFVQNLRTLIHTHQLQRVFPLSFAQQRLWFLHQIMPDNPSYNIPGLLRFRGTLSTAVLQRSIEEIISRHQTLRTTIITRDGSPSQLIGAPFPIAFPVIDLQHLPLEQRESTALYIARQAAQLAFDLASGPLMRIVMLRLREQDHFVLATIHHLVFDFWSAGVLIRELAVLYEAFSTQQPSPLPALPIQYVDFAFRQREMLQGDVMTRHLTYWQKQLQGARALTLDTDYPRTALHTFRGQAEHFTLSPHLSEALVLLSQQEGVTLFMTLLAAFNILLSRYTRETDIVVGTDIANRTTLETEALIGFFVNLLALRTNLAGKPAFLTLLQRVRDVVLNAYAHQDLPFDMVVEALQLARNANRTPLVNILFVFQNAPMPPLKIKDLSLEIRDLDIGTSNFDIVLFMWEGANGLTGTIHYSSDLFQSTTILTLLRQFEVLLHNIVAHPHGQIDTFEIYTQEEMAHRKQEEVEQLQANRDRLRVTKRRVIGPSQ